MTLARCLGLGESTASPAPLRAATRAADAAAIEAALLDDEPADEVVLVVVVTVLVTRDDPLDGDRLFCTASLLI